jgi:hypothetical protein
MALPAPGFQGAAHVPTRNREVAAAGLRILTFLKRLVEEESMPCPKELARIVEGKLPTFSSK